jgi:hypothetical protein
MDHQFKVVQAYPAELFIVNSQHIKTNETKLNNNELHFRLHTENHNFTPCFYGLVSWSLTLREKYRMRVLRRIFGLKREEARGYIRVKEG